jgi:predicted helicase
MRHHLMQTFSDVYVLDLHGSSMKREGAPDGVHGDDNVFDIRQGVAIALFIKRADSSRPATVRHAELWGGRVQKYEWLTRNDVTTTDWDTLSPVDPFYLFTPINEELREEYEKWWRVPDIMDRNGTPAPGVVTMHDNFAISWSRQEAAEKVGAFIGTRSEREARGMWRLSEQRDNVQWDYQSAKTSLSAGGWESELLQLLYRPFDLRSTVFNQAVAVHRRLRVMRHMIDADNIALAVGRAGQVVDAWNWDLVFASREVTDLNLFRRGGHYLFPLYLIPDDQTEEQLKFSTSTATGSALLNLNPDFVQELATALGLSFVQTGKGDLMSTFGPMDVFDYVYAILHSPTFRTRYQEFLRVDFPRVPMPELDVFRDLCPIGEELVGLHTERLTAVAERAVTYPSSGNNIVASSFPQYFPPNSPNPLSGEPLENGRVYISRWHRPRRYPGQYFDGIPEDVWDFTVGGYRVCHKWLKDRRGRELSHADVSAYRRICGAVARTLELMDMVDAAVGSWPPK